MGRILLADDHPLFRHALRVVISRAHPQLGICEAETLAGAKAILAREQDVTLVMLDLKMSDCGDFNGLLSLRGAYPQIPVVVVSSASDPSTISHALALGAAGFIPKSSTRAEIARAMATILAGEIWAPAISYPAPVSEGVRSIASLTPAQLQILMGLQRGLRNKEIAYDMGVTEKTVKAYMTTMFRKLGVNSRTQALISVQALKAEAELTA
jgi:DNA-binding NarL/FixJ family response regulator